MPTSSDRDVYYARCLRVAAAAVGLGMTMRKGDGPRGHYSLVLEGNGRSVDCPIVSDERAWRETSVEEALYVVLLDARGWSEAHVDDSSVATLVGDVERSELPLIRKDLGEELARIAVLESMVGGRAQLESLWSNLEATTA